MQLSAPNRVQVFMMCIYMWSWFILQLNILANLMLKAVIIIVPNLMLVDIKPNTPLRIIKAIDSSGYDITKKLNIFINFKWDNDCIDLDSFCEYIGSSVIWVTYVLECDISEETCDKFLNFVKSIETSDDSLPIEKVNILEFKKHIRTIVVNTSKKIVYKLKEDKLILEDIVFGEIEFD